jgi:hypothetical protein
MRLFDLAVRIERAPEDSKEQHDLCDKRDALLSLFRKADDARPSPPEAKALSAAIATLADKLDSDSYGVVDDDHTSGRLDAYRDVAEQLREMLAAHASTDAATT